MQTIYHKGRRINFTLNRKNVKNINLRINSQGEVRVSANPLVPLDLIMEFVQSKAAWIHKHLEDFEKRKLVEKKRKKYIDGESFKYLGEEYSLRLFESKKERVEFKGSFIDIYVKDKYNLKWKEKLLDDWYKGRSRIVFEESLSRMYELVRAYGIEYPELKLRKMKARWGTCYPNRSKIIINRVLVKAPIESIDYVILHELIHFKHRNHKSGFYKLLDRLMPDWKERKKILNQEISREL